MEFGITDYMVILYLIVRATTELILTATPSWETSLTMYKSYPILINAFILPLENYSTI